MAIDYGFKLALDIFGDFFIRFLEERGLVKNVQFIRSYGPVEITVQKRPLRTDYVFCINDYLYVIIEAKSEKDHVEDEDIFKVLLYTIGIAMRKRIPPKDLGNQFLVTIIAPYRKNFRCELNMISAGIYHIPTVIPIYALVVEEIKLEEEIIWFKVLSKSGRQELYRYALEKGIFKILGILILIDEDIRRLAMTDEKIIGEAIREIGETLGYDKLIRIFAEHEEELVKVLREIGETLGYDKLIRIIVDVFKIAPETVRKELMKKLSGSS